MKYKFVSSVFFCRFLALYLGFALGLILLDGATANGELVAHWKADGTAVDATGNGHDGTLVNGTQYGPGVAGQAFLFDGIDDIDVVKAHPALEPATISVALWVRSSSDGGLRLVSDSSHGGDGGFDGWAIQIGSEHVGFAYGNGSGFPEVFSNSIVADNKFHHIAATLDGATMRIYVDGTLDNTLGFSGTAAPSGRDIMFGGWYANSPNRQLDGLVDDIRIYNHVLSLAEIEALASTGSVHADNFNIFRGIHAGGDLSDTFDSDDSYLKFNPGVTINSVEPPVWIEFEGTLPSDSPTSLSITLEANASTVGLNQTVEMFNYNSGQYEQVDAQTASWNADSVVIVNVTANIADYVQTGTGAVKSRTGWRATGPILNFPWTICIDQVVWTVTE